MSVSSNLSKRSSSISATASERSPSLNVASNASSSILTRSRSVTLSGLSVVRFCLFFAMGICPTFTFVSLGNHRGLK